MEKVDFNKIKVLVFNDKVNYIGLSGPNTFHSLYLMDYVKQQLDKNKELLNNSLLLNLNSNIDPYQLASLIVYETECGIIINEGVDDSLLVIILPESFPKTIYDFLMNYKNELDNAKKVLIEEVSIRDNFVIDLPIEEDDKTNSVSTRIQKIYDKKHRKAKNL